MPINVRDDILDGVFGKKVGSVSDASDTIYFEEDMDRLVKIWQDTKCSKYG